MKFYPLNSAIVFPDNFPRDSEPVQVNSILSEKNLFLSEISSSSRLKNQDKSVSKYKLFSDLTFSVVLRFGYWTRRGSCIEQSW